MKTKRKMYLDRKPLEEVLPAFLEAVRVPDPIPAERVTIQDNKIRAFSLNHRSDLVQAENRC